ncbi:hypothetical protein FW774_17230 [Pedobacter sp. BS3]|uniref:hypothetical protein n=1 Tax=Pedobacter sp. BS3 TaxID=2567937 RepID=UPI0011EE7B75|nr:hypothetical protein [Pedobacter sp. BS3]TZF81799.1 hypothetical protein FW774_17230 [Pedobacter sp. BS3]
MKKYILTSKSFTGAVEFGFNSTGTLVFYNNAADMSDKQTDWLLAHLPPNEVYLNQLKVKISGELKEVPPDLSFDTFWTAYDKKIHAIRCKPLWNKLKDTDKMRAIMQIKPYDAYCARTGIAKANPENYLKKQYYETDWNREK